MGNQPLMIALDITEPHVLSADTVIFEVCISMYSKQCLLIMSLFFCATCLFTGPIPAPERGMLNNSTVTLTILCLEYNIIDHHVIEP